MLCIQISISAIFFSPTLLSDETTIKTEQVLKTLGATVGIKFLTDFKSLVQEIETEVDFIQNGTAIIDGFIPYDTIVNVQSNLFQINATNMFKELIYDTGFIAGVYHYRSWLLTTLDKVINELEKESTSNTNIIMVI